MIVTLGPEGTFSSVATQEIFPKERVIYEQNFYSIFQKLKLHGGKAVLPLENSVQGTVREVWNFLNESNFKIFHVYRLSIGYSLGARKKTFAKIASHPQALGQCRMIIQKYYSEKDIIPVSSTAQAIRLAEEDSTVAAIAAPDSLAQSSLEIIRKNLKINDENATLFGVIARKPLLKEKKIGQMSVVVAPRKDRPGLLFDLLKPFSEENVNLTRIESQAAGKKLGDYVFFMDFKGDLKNASVKRVLKKLEKLARVKVIGEY